MTNLAVIIPVYNAAPFLRAALGSIAAQTNTDFRCFVIDDGSSDESADIAVALGRQDRRFVAHRRSHQGVVAALNVGIELSEGHGNFIARMDADDIAKPERFERQLSYLERHPEVLALGSSMDVFASNSSKVTFLSAVTDSARLHGELVTDCRLYHPTVMMRRDALAAVGSYRPFFWPAEDHDLWLRFSEIGRLANLPEPLLSYRRHPGQVGRRFHVEQIVASAAAVYAGYCRRRGQSDPAATASRPQDLACALVDALIKGGFPLTKLSIRLGIRAIAALEGSNQDRDRARELRKAFRRRLATPQFPWYWAQLL